MPPTLGHYLHKNIQFVNKLFYKTRQFKYSGLLFYNQKDFPGENN